MGGGGGGGGGWGDILLCFVYRCFVFVVLVLVVYSIVSCSHMSCVLFLVLHAVVGNVSVLFELLRIAYFAYVGESFVSCLCVSGHSCIE